jgi:hypothetical protein
MVLNKWLASKSALFGVSLNPYPSTNKTAWFTISAGTS